MSAPRDLTLNVCQGVGDIIWAYQKFARHVASLDLNVCCVPGQNTAMRARAAPFLRLLPRVRAVRELDVDVERYKALASGRFPMADILARARAGQDGFDYSCNRPLEEGVRIEDIDPHEVETDVGLECRYAPLPFERFGAVYVSGSVLDPEVQRRGVWTVPDWARFLVEARARGPALPLLLIGASYDRPAVAALCDGLAGHGVPHASLIDAWAPNVAYLLARASFFVGYQSGLSVVADLLDVRQVMVYFESLAPMTGAWAKRRNIASGVYRAALFSERPEAAAARLGPLC